MVEKPPEEWQLRSSLLRSTCELAFGTAWEVVGGAHTAVDGHIQPLKPLRSLGISLNIGNWSLSSAFRWLQATFFTTARLSGA